MAYRKKMGRRRSKKLFRKTASKTHIRNALRMRPRGGNRI